MGFDYNRDGFVYVKNAFQLNDLEAYERALMRVNEKVTGGASSDPISELQSTERSSPQDFYRVCSESGGTLAGLRLLTSPTIIRTLKELFGADAETLQLTHPIVFWNDPNVPRLQYRWHQESAYFRGIPNGCHIWFPLFSDTTLESGPMQIKVGSHEKHYDYIYTKTPGSLTQLEPVVDLDQWQTHDCICKRGDAIVFHQNTIHRTGQNLTDRPRVSGIIRVQDSMSCFTWNTLMGFVYKDTVAQQVEDDGWDGTGPGGA